MNLLSIIVGAAFAAAMVVWVFERERLLKTIAQLRLELSDREGTIHMLRSRRQDEIDEDSDEQRK